jgi:glutaminyl-peptide cyclotransferase
MGSPRAILAALCFAAACGREPAGTGTAARDPAPPAAPSPERTSGFDGARAYEHVRRLVRLGPRPPGSEASRAAQAYLAGELRAYGCAVEEHDFTAGGPMRNIVARIPGRSANLVLFATHYDTVRIPDFVGADDGGSGTGVMLELARLLCRRRNALSVKIAFFDGEEAQGQWADRNSVTWTSLNSTFGSREMAAQMALSGELKRVKAMILADMIGPSDLKLKRDTNSTPWLVDLLWETAGRLGYREVFVNAPYPVSGDDHFSFLKRGVAACDLIDFDVQSTYWHTREDTLDKVDPRSLAIVGHVLLEALPALERKFP